MAGMKKLSAAVAVAVILSGCNSGAAGASGGSAAAEGGAAAGGGAPAGPPVKQNIVDPSFNNMPAFTVTIPAGWHFQGTLQQGTGQCVPTPFPVFRVTSPDGLSAFEREPTIGWKSGTGPFAAVTAPPGGQTDCVALKASLRAQDFLKYLAPSLGLTYVSDVAEPAAENQQAQAGLVAAEAAIAPKYAAEHLTPPKNTREMARARVSFQNGSFAMLGELRVQLDCSESVYAGIKQLMPGMPSRPASDVTVCQASTRFYYAPSAQLTSVLALLDTPGMGAVGSQAWQQAWVARYQQQANQAESKNIAATNAAMAASHQMFEQSMAAQAQEHQQFMATLQRGTDLSMGQAQAGLNAQSTASSDWVNYALDQQTVMDPNTGQISTVSSASSYTWMDGSGKTYQTSDSSANPNGVMPGTWTKQQVVHGNGTPK
jgi:hypothetical protein